MSISHRHIGNGSHRVRTLTVAAGLAIAALAVTACSSGSSSSSSTSASGSSSSSAATAGKTTTIRVTYVYSTTLLPVYVANAEGIFAKNGLKIEQSPEASPVLATSALGKQYDLAMQTPSGYLAAVQQGLPIIAVSNCAENNSQTPNTYVMVPDNSSIKTLKDLVGKRVGVVNPTSASTIALEYVAQEEGLGKNAFTFVTVPFANMEDQLKAGNIAAAVPVIPYSSVIQQAGYRSISTPTVQASQLAIKSDQSTNAFFIANKSWAQQNPSVISAWRTSLTEAMAWIAANKTAALQLATQMTGLPTNVVQNSPLSTFTATLTENDLKSAAIEDQAVGATKTLQSTSGLILP